MTQPVRMAVIMAGGSGERFWPLSRRNRPKQLLKLTQPDQTLLEEAIERVAPVIPPERIFIVTGRHLVDPIRRACTALPPENVIGEPAKRNTAGCLVYAAAKALAHQDGAEKADAVTMAVLTADHTIDQPDRFCATVEAALEFAEREPYLVTIGIAPTRPETGYGYIEVAESAKALASAAGARPAIYPVEHFREKPDRAAAEQFVATGRFYWNSGMFFWRLSTFLDELDAAAPAFADATRRMAEALAAGDDAAADRIFESLDNNSIDYALMEKARRVAVVAAAFPWDDVGAWDVLARDRPHDADGNVAVGNPILIDTRNAIVYNEPGAERMAVATVGVEDLVVVVTNDAVLVIPKSRAQEVRCAIEALKQRGANQL